MENPIKMGWFGGTTIFGNIHIDESFNRSFCQALAFPAAEMEAVQILDQLI